MNKLMMAAMCALTFGTTFAAASEKQQESVKVGGEGRLAFIHTADVAAAPLRTVAGKLTNILMIETCVTNGVWRLQDAEAAVKGSGANAVVFVVKDKSLPLSLLAAESRWGVVNAEGLSESGVEKEAMRVASLVLGAFGSKYPASSMRPVFSKGELETKAGSAMTFDTMIAICSYMEGLGIKPYQVMTREEAIEEGYLKEDGKAKATK